MILFYYIFNLQREQDVNYAIVIAIDCTEIDLLGSFFDFWWNAASMGLIWPLPRCMFFCIP